MADAETLFLGYESADLSEAYFSLIPAPHDATATIGGQAAAPRKILDASSLIEDYDEETGLSLVDMVGIHTLAPETAPQNPLQLESWVKDNISKALAATAVPIILGGDGTVTLWGIEAMQKACPELSVLHIDSNADLDDAEDDEETHHTVMRRVLELKNAPTICQVGVRSLSRDAMGRIMDSTVPVETFFMADIDRDGEDSWQDVIDELRSPVYLSIDLTGLDPSILPAVGTPEPGGLGWWQLLRLLRKVASRRRIAAIDITELCPSAQSLQSDFAAARLIYKIMNYIQDGGKMLAKP